MRKFGVVEKNVQFEGDWIENSVKPFRTPVHYSIELIANLRIELLQIETTLV